MDDWPNRLTINRLIRRPRSDFTTAIATRKAITTSSTLALAKPAKAFAGETVPVRTAAATASSADGSSGKEPISTEAIAAANTANRCQGGLGADLRPNQAQKAQRLRF